MSASVFEPYKTGRCHLVNIRVIGETHLPSEQDRTEASSSSHAEEWTDATPSQHGGIGIRHEARRIGAGATPEVWRRPGCRSGHVGTDAPRIGMKRPQRDIGRAANPETYPPNRRVRECSTSAWRSPGRHRTRATLTHPERRTRTTGMEPNRCRHPFGDNLTKTSGHSAQETPRWSHHDRGTIHDRGSPARSRTACCLDGERDNCQNEARQRGRRPGHRTPSPGTPRSGPMMASCTPETGHLTDPSSRPRA